MPLFQEIADLILGIKEYGAVNNPWMIHPYVFADSVGEINSERYPKTFIKWRFCRFQGTYSSPMGPTVDGWNV